MAKPKITLYLDVVSPFAYLAYVLLRTSSVFQPCEINYVPIFLGGVMKATGNKPPISVHAKSIWINEERRRWAALYDIPMPEGAPDGFPVNTITIQRALTALNSISPTSLIAAIDMLFQKFWGERNVEAVDKPEGLSKALIAAIGEDLARKVMESIGTEEVKKSLGVKSQEALDAGAFGLPWFVVTNAEGKSESFWGFDHIGQICAYLGLEKPKDSGWKAML